ncbi:MAG: hypothetical protein R3B83_01605 [Nitrospirales bacterium]|nr:hypothetical protein [Nitrospirales bacterium]
MSSFVKLLWEVGLQTERDYISSLGDQAVVDLQTLPVEPAFQETLLAMEQGPLLFIRLSHAWPVCGAAGLVGETGRWGVPFRRISL